ncbi:peptidylprolyl isomerase [Sphingomonas sp. 37zxx]|uniref:peptidylprolyl isomerase n=1 Tax=Sphingomonas sp. 37zxx TaxID=1550073 RepID=UPI00068A9189|nr:peptidylprolyl isomerase [Sphingomonas sp. 37zxx]
MKRFSALAAATMLAGIAAAQTVSDPQAGSGQEAPASNLNLPRDLQVFGKADPNIRKATAIVNEAVITGTDVDQRLAMITGLRGVQVSAEERDQLRLQVLRAIIDETLQIQEAANNDIKVAKAEIDQSFARVSRNFERTPEQMTAFLTQIGSSDRSLRRQIEGELAWTRLLRRQVEPFISVGEEEVNAIIARLEAAKGTEETHLKEIYLSATPDRAAEVMENGRKMIEAMRGGTPFEYFARNFSEATTKAVEGDLGWISPAVLPEPLAQAARTMQVGQIAGPIEIPGGYSILYMVDKRQVLMADPRDARLSLRQVAVKFPTALTPTQVQARADEFAELTQSIQGCGNVNAVAQKIGAEVVDNDSIRIRELPAQLQEMMMNLQVGQATPPFGSPSEGVRVLVLCGRDDPAAANAPNPEQIQAGLEQERVNLRAQRMLRDLRRDAIVDYR